MSVHIVKDSPLLTTGEAAKFLRCHPESIRRRIREGELPAIRMGVGAKSSWLIRMEDICHPQ